MEITTNNVPRDLIYSWELTEQEREDFDWIFEGRTEEDLIDESETFFRYKGTLYSLSEFMTTSMPFGAPQFGEWHGYHSDTFFSAVLIKYVDDYERVIVGLALS